MIAAVDGRDYLVTLPPGGENIATMALRRR